MRSQRRVIAESVVQLVRMLLSDSQSCCVLGSTPCSTLHARATPTPSQLTFRVSKLVPVLAGVNSWIFQGWICRNLPGGRTFLTLKNSRSRAFFARFARTGQHLFSTSQHTFYISKGSRGPRGFNPPNPPQIQTWLIDQRL